MVRPFVRAVLEELVEQIAIRPMDLDAIETGALRVLRAPAIGFDDARNFRKLQCSRDRIGLFGPQQAYMTFCGDGARRDGLRSVEIDRVRNAPDMPQLQHDAATCVMHGARDRAPTFGLLFRPDARSVRISNPHWRDGGRLGDDQASRSPLQIVVPHQRIRNASQARPTTRQRRHDDAVRQLQLTEPEGLEEN